MRKLRTLFNDAAKTARLMVGVPDYDNYVEHRKTFHPNEPIMTYREFFWERQNARYGCGNGRFKGCC
ncbi:MAG: YbdD/YjiX family protein [Verrucomicrobia bacterium]|nr:YbdD/YjiX family protein [Verrucomicrobiota bacterium]